MPETNSDEVFRLRQELRACRADLQIAHAEYLEQAKRPKSALDLFMERGGNEETDPIERLRFFCSKAMDGQDWLDVEPFINDCVAMIRSQRNENSTL